jgi:hypothetical protein
MASITGNVVDATGAVVQQATITIKSQETGATRTVSTDDSGNYRFLALPLGPQELKAEKQGFKSIIRAGVSLQVGQEAVVNFRLELGELIQQMNVSERAPIVNVTTASVSGIVDERQVKELPLNGRSFDNLIALNPGAINYSALKSPNTATSNGNTFSVAGRRTNENLFLLNGVEYMGSSQLAVTPGGTSGYLLGIDAVREFNVLTDTYSAEYGKRAGAQVSVVTQSGTNQFHGTIFEFLRNSALDSPGPFDNGTVPAFRRNQFGGAAGGPLKKDRLFLFAKRLHRRINSGGEGKRYDGAVCFSLLAATERAGADGAVIGHGLHECGPGPKRYRQGFLQSQRAPPGRFRHSPNRFQSR